MTTAPMSGATLTVLATWLSFLATGVAQPAAAQQDSLDLAAALALARVRSPAIAAADAAVAGAEGQLGSARANRWARLNADALYLRFQNPPGVGLGARGSLAPIPENGYYAQLGLEQSLYTGGKVASAIRTAEWGTRANAASRVQAEVQLTAAVARAHDGVLLAQALLRVAEEGEAALDSASRLAQSRFAAGTADRLDVLRAETRLASAQAEVRAAGTSLASARERLAASIGLDPAAAPPVWGTLEPVDLALDSAAVRALLERARTGRPDLEAFEAASRAAEARARMAKASLRPTAGIFLYGLVTRPELITERKEWNGNVYGGLVVRWPILDFGAASGEAAAAVLGLARDLNRTGVDVAAGRVNVSRAEAALALAQDRYAEGVGIQLEVLEAEADLGRARADLLRAIHGQRSAAVELSRVTGRPADGALLPPARAPQEGE